MPPDIRVRGAALKSTYSVVCLTVLFASTIAAAEIAPRPDSLHVVDRNRASLVKRIVDEWGPTLSARSPSHPESQAFAERLWALRSDRLLAASLAGDLDTIVGLFNETRAESQQEVDPLRREVVRKAIGDSAADLVYTPLTPCRIADTRNALGALQPNTARTLVGFDASSFAAQGGTPTSCGIPNSVAALALNVYAVNPMSLGFIKLWASNQTEPDVSTVNYQPPTVAIATGAIVPVDPTDSNKFKASSPASVDLVVDVVGYFRSASDGVKLDLTLAGTRVARYSMYLPFSPTIVAGDASNTAPATEWGVTIAGGGQNIAACDNPSSGLDGSCTQRAFGSFATIGGGTGNSATHFGTVAGGRSNRAVGQVSTISGGAGNTVLGFAGYVGGGVQNRVMGDNGVVAGGENNVVTATNGIVGAGRDNQAGGYASLLGGRGNLAAGAYAFLGGGQYNTASGINAVVAGGEQNNGSGIESVIAGGRQNVAAGILSTVLGGHLNATTGMYALAAGRRAKALADGCFTWGDSSDADVSCGDPNKFVARATGGVTFGTNVAMTTGCSISAGGGSWSCTSSRDEKRDFTDVDTREVLDRVAAMPITTWRYNSESSGALHLGPMAQDFYAAFHLGHSDRSIAVVDANGVALAAIQGLNAKLESRLAERDSEVSSLRAALSDLDSLRAEIQALKEALKTGLR
jgi:hypothetical protein